MKNRFTVENTAMLLIDHQVGTIKFARSIDHDELVRNTRALARAAVELGMPLVLTTSQEDHFQGPLLPDLLEIAPEAHERRIRRPGVVDAWAHDGFREAVLATGRNKLIMCGLTNDVCIVYPAISATEDGFEVQVVADAGGSPSKQADEVALQRMRDAGVTVTSTVSALAELAQDWSTPAGERIAGTLYQEIQQRLVEA